MNFSTDRPKQENWRRRLLAPRLIIYSLLALGLAWMMHHYNSSVAKQPTAAKPTLKPYPDAPVLRDSTLQTAQKTLPMLVLVATNNTEAAPSAAYLREKFAGRCTVVLLHAGRDQEALTYFKISSNTAAILFAPDNVECERWEIGLSPEPLAERVETALKRLLETP